jgi:hypothetical protein
MTTSDGNPVFDAALALPPDSRAELAHRLLDSLADWTGSANAPSDTSNDELREFAERLTAHFHEAKRTALAGAVDGGARPSKEGQS